MSDLRYRATVDVAQAEANLKKLEGSVNKLNDTFINLKNALAGIAIGSFITQSTNLAAKLDTLGQVTGIATSNLRGFQLAVGQAGGNSDQAADAISDLVKNVGEAANGGKELVSAFNQVGVSFDDLNRLPMDVILGKVIQGLAGIQDEAKRSAIGMKIMGEAVKTVDFRSVASSYGTFSAQSSQFAESARAAREAQEKMALAMDRLRESVVIALKPLNDLIASLDPKAIAVVASTLVDIGKALALLFVATKAASGVRFLVDAFRSLSGATIASTGMLKDAAVGVRYLKDAFNLKTAAIVKSYTGFGILGQTLKSLSGAFIRLIPLVGALYAGFQLLDGVIELLTGRNISAWFDEAAAGLERFVRDVAPGLADALDALGEKLGMAPSPSAQRANEQELQRLKARAEAAREATANANRGQESQKRIADAAAKTALETRHYVDNLAISLSRKTEAIDLERRLIELSKLKNIISEDEVEILKAQDEARVESLAAVKRLEQEREKLQLQASQLQDGEQKRILNNQIAGIDQQIKKTEEYYAGHSEGLRYYITQLQGARLLEKDRLQTQENLKKAIEDQIARQQQLGDTLKSINDQRVDLNFEQSLKGLSPLQREVARINENARKAALEAGRAFAAGFESEDGLTPERAEELANGLQAIAQGYRDIAQAQINALGPMDEFTNALQKSFETYKEDAMDLGKQIKNSFDNFTKGMEDAFVNFVMTGKLSFKDLANSILADLARVAVKKAIVFFGTKLFGFAEGGEPPVGVPSIVGEKGPELFVPKTAGTIIPNSALKGGPGGDYGFGGGKTVVNYNINAVDAASFRSLVARDPSFIYAVTEQGRRSQPTRRMM